MSKTVHIVCLQVPYPPDYGGVVDLFWKLKYLHELGVTIHLHCFEYGRGAQNELLQYCATVQYYKRLSGVTALRWNTPYIVSSRISKKLERALMTDDHPVLLEGIHCTWLLHKGILKNRKVILRLHNVEWDYYQQLAAAATSVLKKGYYRLESRLLKKYEPSVIAKATASLAVSEKDAVYWQQQQMNRVQFLPVFLPWNTVVSKEGNGDYYLYHGNLGVPENEKTALWLIDSVFVAIPGIRFIIAGKDPSEALLKAAAMHNDITIIANPSATAMEQLIADAHVHVLPSFTNSGIKLKLLHALFCGRFCIVNRNMVQGTGLENICIVANDATAFIHAILQCFEDAFPASHIKEREGLLTEYYNNRTNARMLAEML